MEPPFFCMFGGGESDTQFLYFGSADAKHWIEGISGYHG